VFALALLSLAMATFLLVHFALIWVCGRFYIFESNILVPTMETTMMVAILCFSIYCMVEQLRKKDN
jgi:hypothetical protein